MAIEKKFAEVSAEPILQDGNAFGIVVVSDTIRYKVKQIVFLKSSTQVPAKLQIKRIVSRTQMIVGDPSKSIQDYSNISQFLTADGATINALEQNRPKIDMADVIAAVYSEEPAVALRNVLVDAYGDYITEQNPLGTAMVGVREDGEYGTADFSNNNSVKVAVTERQSEVRGRVSVTIPIVSTSLAGGAPVVLYTVTSGYRLYISSFLTSALNTSTQDGSFRLRDNTIDKVGFLIPPRVSGSSPSSFSSASPSLPEPLMFQTNVNFIQATGNVSIAGYLIGYEEPI